MTQEGGRNREGGSYGRFPRQILRAWRMKRLDAKRRGRGAAWAPGREEELYKILFFSPSFDVVAIRMSSHLPSFPGIIFLSSSFDTFFICVTQSAEELARRSVSACRRKNPRPLRKVCPHACVMHRRLWSRLKMGPSVITVLLPSAMLLLLPPPSSALLFRDDIAASGRDCAIVLEKFARPQNLNCEMEEVNIVSATRHSFASSNCIPFFIDLREPVQGGLHHGHDGPPAVLPSPLPSTSSGRLRREPD